LGDSDLWLEIEKDYTVYGDECVFGGGKVIREGMGQCTDAKDSETLDVVITNAVVIDHWGIVKVNSKQDASDNISVLYLSFFPLMLSP
jgi:urease alpha subunit